MLKRSLMIVVVMAVLLFLFQFLAGRFYKEHDIKYDVKNIKVNEIYEKNKEDDYYFISFKYNNEPYSFTIDNIFNHQKKIVSDLEIKQSNGVTCIMPKFIYDNDYNLILCKEKGKSLSYNMVKDKIDINNFKNFKAKNEYKNDLTLDQNKKYYYKNLSKEDVVALYNYNHISLFDSKGRTRFDFAPRDIEIYYNKLSTKIKNIYLTPLYNKEKLIDSYMGIDLINKRVDYYTFTEPLADTIFIQGIVDNKLYIMSKSTNLQYIIDPINHKMETVADESQGKYFDGKTFKNKSLTNMANNNITFPIPKYKALENEEYIYVTSDSRSYFFYTKDYNFYMVYKKDLNNKILLYSNPKISDADMSSNMIYFIEGNKLKKASWYNTFDILEDDKLKDNYKNIVKGYYNVKYN